MAESVITIGDTDYSLEEVVLSITDRAESDWDLEFDLFADCEDLTRAGFAINCMSVAGMRKADELAGYELHTSDDELNELAESAICEPGKCLELLRLDVKFGAFDGDHISVRLTATCVDTKAEPARRVLQVRGQFSAHVRVRRPYANL